MLAYFISYRYSINILSLDEFKACVTFEFGDYVGSSVCVAFTKNKKSKIYGFQCDKKYIKDEYREIIDTDITIKCNVSPFIIIKSISKEEYELIFNIKKASESVYFVATINKKIKINESCHIIKNCSLLNGKFIEDNENDIYGYICDDKNIQDEYESIIKNNNTIIKSISKEEYELIFNIKKVSPLVYFAIKINTNKINESCNVNDIIKIFGSYVGLTIKYGKYDTNNYCIAFICHRNYINDDLFNIIDTLNSTQLNHFNKYEIFSYTKEKYDLLFSSVDIITKLLNEISYIELSSTNFVNDVNKIITEIKMKDIKKEDIKKKSTLNILLDYFYPIEIVSISFLILSTIFILFAMINEINKFISFRKLHSIN